MNSNKDLDKEKRELLVDKASTEKGLETDKEYAKMMIAVCKQLIESGKKCRLIILKNGRSERKGNRTLSLN